MSSIGRLALGSVVGGALLALMACGSRASEADAGPPQDLASLRDFTAVTLAGPDKVIVRRGAGFSVQAQGDPRALARLEIGVRNGVLRIRRKNDWRDIMPGEDHGATINVTLPALRQVTLAGSGDMNVDLLGGDAVDASVTGSGDLTIERVDARRVDFAAVGSGTLTTLGGRAGQAKYSVTGSGDLKTRGVASSSGTVSIVGSGDVEAHITGDADVSILGSGDAAISGTTRCSISRVGSGEARCAA